MATPKAVCRVWVGAVMSMDEWVGCMLLGGMVMDGVTWLAHKFVVVMVWQESGVMAVHS